MKEVTKRPDGKTKEVLYFDELHPNVAVFGKRHEDDKFGAMVIREDSGYITRTPDSCGSSGHHNTLIECLTEDSLYWDFYIND